MGFSDECRNSGVSDATTFTSCCCSRLLRRSSPTLVNTTLAPCSCGYSSCMAPTGLTAGYWGGGGGGCPAGGGGKRPCPLAILVSQWHFRVVWLDDFASLWNLQGASRVCSYDKAGNQLALPPF